MALPATSGTPQQPTNVTHDQWIRKGGLHVVSTDGTKEFDLSELRFVFRTTQSDYETPNRVEIRVYNLDEKSAAKIVKEYDYVILQAGYQNGKFAQIFAGTIKQFRYGRESMTDTYLDILAADCDLSYIFGYVNATVRTPDQQKIVDTVLKSYKAHDPNIAPGYMALSPHGGVLPRGKVFYGMGRATLRDLGKTTLTSWSIQNGKLTMLPLTGYLPGEAVVLDSHTGMIGTPEATDNGVFVRCLLNPAIEIGGLIRIDNASINKLIAAAGQDANRPLAWDQWAQPQMLPSEANDGLYRVYVIEHSGDMRGQDWYSEITCLAANESSPPSVAVKRFG